MTGQPLPDGAGSDAVVVGAADVVSVELATAEAPPPPPHATVARFPDGTTALAWVEWEAEPEPEP